MRLEIIEIIDTLPPRQNMAVHLCFCEKLTQSHAARIMHVSQPTIYRILRTALRTLRRELSE